MIDIYEKECVTCLEAKLPREGRRAGTVFLFLVDGMLIDTGPQSIESYLLPFYRTNKIDTVVLTHHHEDHTGTASWLQKEREIPVYIHPRGIAACREPCNYPKYRQESWGVRKPFSPLSLGDRIPSRHEEWEVIYTPGHSNDHIALFHEETGRLFSGDLFVTPRPKVIMKTESVPTIKSSIRSLLKLGFTSMFCSHSGYIENGRTMLQEKLDHLEALTEEVTKLYGQGDTVADINKKIFPKKYAIVEASGGEWDSLHIVSSIINEELKK